MLQSSGVRQTINDNEIGADPRRSGRIQPKPKPGRMRGNEQAYRNFAGDLSADMSGFNLNGTALQGGN